MTAGRVRVSKARNSQMDEVGSTLGPLRCLKLHKPRGSLCSWDSGEMHSLKNDHLRCRLAYRPGFTTRNDQNMVLVACKCPRLFIATRPLPLHGVMEFCSYSDVIRNHADTFMYKLHPAKFHYSAHWLFCVEFFEIHQHRHS